MSSMQLKTSLLKDKTDNSKSPQRKSAPKKELGPVPPYDPMKFPPDLDLAQLHGRARRVYHRDLADISRKCSCCGLPCDNLVELSLGCSLDDFNHLGAAYPLFFELTKHVILLLMIPFIISGIFAIYSNWTSDDCEGIPPVEQDGIDPTPDPYCPYYYLARMSIANKRNHLDAIEAQFQLDVISVLIMVIYTIFMLFQLQRKANEFSEGILTPSDFTIQINGLHPDLKNEEIKRYVEGFSTQACAVKVIKVLRTHVLGDYLTLSDQKDELQYELEHTNSQEIKSRIKTKLEQIEKTLKDKYSVLNVGTVVFVILHSKRQTQYIIKKMQKNVVAEFFNKFKKVPEVNIKRAPEPTDISWAHLNEKPIKVLGRRIATLLIKIVLLATTTLLITLILKREYGIEEATNGFWLTVLQIIVSIVTLILNRIVTNFIIFIGKKASYITKTTQLAESSVAYFAQRILTGIISVALAKALLSTDIWSDLILLGGAEGFLNFINALNFYGTGGLLYYFYWFMTNGCIFICISSRFDIPQILRKRKIEKLLKDPSSCKLPQYAAHKLFQGGKFSIQQRYGFIAASSTIAFLFGCALPAGLFVTICGLIVFYYTSKYYLIRHAKLPNNTGDKITERILYILQFAPCFYAAGILFVYYTLNFGYESLGNYQFIAEGISPLYWILALIISGLILIPVRKIYKKISPKEEQANNTHYEDVKKEFQSDYEVEYPITRKQAIDKFLKEAAGKSKEEQMEYMKRMRGQSGNSELKEFLQTFKNKSKKQGMFK